MSHPCWFWNGLSLGKSHLRLSKKGLDPDCGENTSFHCPCFLCQLTLIQISGIWHPRLTLKTTNPGRSGSHIDAFFQRFLKGFLFLGASISHFFYLWQLFLLCNIHNRGTAQINVAFDHLISTFKIYFWLIGHFQ